MPGIHDQVALIAKQRAGAPTGTCRVTTGRYNLGCLATTTGKEEMDPLRKREIDNPSDFGRQAEESIKEATPGSLSELDRRFAEIAKAMPRKPPRN